MLLNAAKLRTYIKCTKKYFLVFKLRFLKMCKSAKRGLCMKLNYLLITTLIFLFFYWPYFCHNLHYNICSSIKFQNNVNVSIHIYAASIALPSGLNNVYALCFVYNRNIMLSDTFTIDCGILKILKLSKIDFWS